MLIRRAEVPNGDILDVRILEGKIADMGDLTPIKGESIIDARRGALVPGIKDHHLHFLSYASSLGSLSCAEFISTESLMAALHAAPPQSNGWIRAVQYHESLGNLNLDYLDRVGPNVPLRIQHRSGRLWILNTPGIQLIREALWQTGFDELPNFRLGLQSGFFYDLDQELGALIGRSRPDVAAASRKLASYGVVGFTDMTPDNSTHTARDFARWQEEGQLLQQVQMAGRADLEVGCQSVITLGPTKVHLHESRLPRFENLCAGIVASHERARPVAVHCTTEVELVFTLAAFSAARTIEGDRIEHASLCNPACLEQIRELGLWVVTQSNFVAERGDAYVSEIEEDAWDDLYRGASFLAASIPFALGTDAPFGCANPWFSMQAATTRRTAGGKLLGPQERITPEQALAGFTGSLRRPTEIAEFGIGTSADLVLLDRPWAKARRNLGATEVRLTVSRGKPIYSLQDRPIPDISPAFGWRCALSSF